MLNKHQAAMQTQKLLFFYTRHHIVLDLE